MKSRTSAVFFLSMGLTACTSYQETRNPTVSGIELSAASMPEAAVVSVPMPEPVRRTPPQRAEAASLWQSGNQGFFGDHRATRVGDILTVNIEIDDEAQLKNASSRSRSGEQGIDGSTMLGYEGKLGKILPGINQEDLPSGDLIDLSSSSASQGKGSINRNEKINLKVAAMIIQRLENGNLVIAGRQEVKVNSELRELRVAGIIRPVDIEMNNTIPYEKIAEARITYGGRGQISAVQKPRYGEDALEIALPY
ncbi:flagellar basal body L-ring protein FlgH [Paracoccus litorisediminis]|uniref:flagellar basal body L-ring protein FlgH n=1 Tax=Paracoccus litorisediminis TaxID=2006130 RepID=UPI00372F7495